MPARTRLRRVPVSRWYIPSMEGRARARPDHHLRWVVDDLGRPSMEGRARARPDLLCPRSYLVSLMTFNGGAGTCPPGPVIDLIRRRAHN